MMSHVVKNQHGQEVIVKGEEDHDIHGHQDDHHHHHQHGAGHEQKHNHHHHHDEYVETPQDLFERKDYQLSRHLPKAIYHNSYLAGGTYFVECFNEQLQKEMKQDCDLDPFKFTVFKKDLSDVLGKCMETKKGRRVIQKDNKIVE